MTRYLVVGISVALLVVGLPAEASFPVIAGLRVVVVDGDDKDVPSAKITLQCGATSPSTGRSNAEGVWTGAALAPASCRLTVHREGLGTTVVEGVELEPGHTATRVVVVGPKTDPPNVNARCLQARIDGIESPDCVVVRFPRRQRFPRIAPLPHRDPEDMCCILRSSIPTKQFGIPCTRKPWTTQAESASLPPWRGAMGVPAIDWDPSERTLSGECSFLFDLPRRKPATAAQ